jgi:hypothetical protein
MAGQTVYKPLTGKVIDQLRKLVPMLGSGNAGEIVNAVSALGRALGADGLDWHDVAGHIAKPMSASSPPPPPPPPPPPRNDIRWHSTKNDNFVCFIGTYRLVAYRGGGGWKLLLAHRKTERTTFGTRTVSNLREAQEAAEAAAKRAAEQNWQ